MVPESGLSRVTRAGNVHQREGDSALPRFLEGGIQNGPGKLPLRIESRVFASALRAFLTRQGP